MIRTKYIVILIAFTVIEAECLNSSLADSNNDGIIDVLDVIPMVELILSNVEFSEIILSIFTLGTSIC